MNDILKAIVYGGLFVIPFLTLYVANDYFFPFITGKNFAFRIIVEVVFVSWILLALKDVSYRPKFSWILSSFAVLLLVMFFANLLGEHPQSSFWSNFERMDGYVTLVHVFLFTTVLGSVLTTKKQWGYFLNATLVAAFIMTLKGFSQLADPEAGTRIESYLGNAAYLAIYMLFHIFIAFWMFVETKVNWQRIIYGLLAVMFIFILMETGTRGTAIGLVTGVTAMVAYIAIFGAKFQEFRRYAIGLFVLLLLGGGTFFALKDSAFIQENPNLARIANIDLGEDLKIRGIIWGMAWDGVKERPVLGWGQSNFNYVFNQNYDPRLYGQEQWFDRVHNIFFDWLIAGGFLGLIAYLSIFVAAIYYLFILPLWKKDDETFTVLERGVLLGILVGYFTHNLVVFDNIVSYIFFAVVLALIHSRVGRPIPQLEKLKIDETLYKQFAVPVAGVLIVFVIYTVNVPGMKAAGGLIDALRSESHEAMYDSFVELIEYDSFAQQEITEHLSQQAIAIAGDPKVPENVRQKFITKAESELNRLVESKPGDARVHVFFGSFYRSINEFEKAKEQMKIARELSPKKQSIITQQAVLAYAMGDFEGSKKFFEEAFLLDENNLDARGHYAALLVKTGENEKARDLAYNEAILSNFANNKFLLSAANDAEDKDFLIDLIERRVIMEPEDQQNWISLSALYLEKGEKEKAVETLERASEAIPGFAKTASCFAENIKANKKPEEGCKI